ncbi:MAG TPA: hypothetical protein VEV84_03820 [Pyrinomonadaceae bacterium]|nr:hypothetical protein [Pyrinomonadaceae bacterium]
MKNIEIIFLIVFITLFISCSSEGSLTTTGAEKDARTMENKSGPQTSGPASNNTQCDSSLWDHVYNHTRLEVIDACKVVTGTIDELDQNPDGDTHMLLKLDAGSEDLLLKKNKTKKNGDLVIEVVCAHPVTDKKAADACKGYTNKIVIPNVGDHVKVTGSYVNDSHNDWAEIHPVSSIEKM